MKTRYFKKNIEYFNFLNKHEIIVKHTTFTKSRKIKLIYKFKNK